MKKFTTLILFLNLLTFIFVTSACCEEKRYSGLTVKEAFQDTAVRGLADAAASGNIKEIDRLVENGVNINGAGTNGITPLWWAITTGNFEAFAHLLNKGANPNVQTGGGHRNVMDLAAIEKITNYLAAAINAGGDVNLVYQPDKTVRYRTPFDGQTPLFSAMLPGNKHNIDLLISKGADLNFQDPDGMTPMMIAAGGNGFDIVYELLIKGADPTLKDKTGNTILWNIKHNSLSQESDGYKWRQKVIDLLKKKGVVVE